MHPLIAFFLRYTLFVGSSIGNLKYKKKPSRSKLYTYRGREENLAARMSRYYMRDRTLDVLDDRYRLFWNKESAETTHSINPMEQQVIQEQSMRSIHHALETLNMILM